MWKELSSIEQSRKVIAFESVRSGALHATIVGLGASSNTNTQEGSLGYRLLEPSGTSSPSSPPRRCHWSSSASSPSITYAIPGLIDRKLRVGPFQSTSMVFAAPRMVSVGDADFRGDHRRSFRTAVTANRAAIAWAGTTCGPIMRSRSSPGRIPISIRRPASIKFAGGRMSQIVSLRDNTERMQYMLEPQLITNLSDRNREKRRLVKFADIPKVLVDAVISAEDKRFFQHAGFDPLRIIKAAYMDLREGRRAQGASTLSMQLARLFWLDQQKALEPQAGRGADHPAARAEAHQATDLRVLRNQVSLGWRGSFNIHGFGEAARAYFGKDLSSSTCRKPPTLAGLIQQPSLFDPYRHPDAARERRNVVLLLMRENGFISDRALWTAGGRSRSSSCQAAGIDSKRRISSIWSTTTCRANFRTPIFRPAPTRLHHARSGPAAGRRRSRPHRHAGGGPAIEQAAAASRARSRPRRSGADGARSRTPARSKRWSAGAITASAS